MTLLPYYHPLLHFTNQLLFLAASNLSSTHHMARLKITARIVSPSNSRLTSSVKSQSPDRPTSSRSHCKRVLNTMDTSVASTTSSAKIPTAPTLSLSNDNLGPVAVRDWPEGCLPPPTINPILTSKSLLHKKSRTKRRLLTQNLDSDDSQSERHSPASSSRHTGSMHSAYHSLELNSSAPTAVPSLVSVPLVPQQPPTLTPEVRPTAPSTSSASHQPLPHPSPALPPTVTPAPIVNHADFVQHLWYGFSVHEMINTQLGLPESRTFLASNLADSIMPASEIKEFHTYRHSFPHVPQKLLPATRPDGIPGQYLHLTQIPHDIPIDSTTGLSHSYQILIRFDFGYHEMTKVEVQNAATARFDAMGIKLASRYREPVSALVHPQTKKWLGFLKVDLLNPSIDGNALLKGDRLFTLQLQDLSYVIGKIEKGFDFSSTATNRRLCLTSPVLTTYTSHSLLGELIRLGYLCGATLEFIGVSKRTRDLDTADVTVASDITKQYLLASPILVDGHSITISLPAAYVANPNTPVALSTSIIVKGLSIDYSQNQVTATLHKLLRPQNILTVTYNRAHDDALGRHDGVATIRCLNSAVYTHWCNRKAIPLLGKLVDFSPHVKSLAGTHPTATAKAQDLRPTREVIAEAITALKNDTATDSTLHQLTNTLQQVEHRLTSHISSTSDGINTHTTTQIDAATAHQLQQHAAIRKQLQLLTSASKEYSLNMTNIFSALHSDPAKGLPNPTALDNQDIVDE